MLWKGGDNMRTWIVVASRVVATLAIVGLLVLPACSPDEMVVASLEVAATPQPTSEDEEPADGEEHLQPLPESVGVDELMQNPELYSGVIRVRGVVSGVSEEDQSLALIDPGEYEECDVTTCADLTLPVRWSGEPPELAQKVELVGDVQEVDGQLIFVATDMQVLYATEEG